MLPSLGEAVLQLRADKSQLQGDVTSAKADLESSLTAIGGALTSLGTKLSVAVTAPIVSVGVVSLKAAADLSEALGKIPVIFGDASTAVINFSTTTAEQLGISQVDALEAAKAFGVMFTQLGVSSGDAAKMSESLIQLAADIAEFNGITPSEALSQLLSGLAGRGMELKRMGVDLTDATVKAKAMAMGLADADGKVSDAAATQARYALIMEQTTKVQGDFARSTGELGTSTTIMKAELADAAAKLGVQLIPYALQAVQAISKLVTWFDKMSPTVQKVVVIVAALAAVLGPVLLIIGQLISVITTVSTIVGAAGPILGTVAGVISGPVGWAILLIIGLVAALYLAWKTNFLGIQDTFNAWVTAIKFIFAAFTAAFHGDWYTFGADLRKAWDTLWNLVRDRFNQAWVDIKGVGVKIVDGIKALFKIDWSELGKNVIDGIITGLTNGIAAILKACTDIGTAIKLAFAGFFNTGSPSKLMEVEVGLPIVQGIGVGINKGMAALNASLAGSLNASMSGFRSLGMQTTNNMNSQRSYVINNYNPTAEPASASVDATLRRLNYLGIA